MIIENFEALNSWLINYLEPKCEADPQVLAKYIMALVKKDKPTNDLKSICLEQLDVFLTKETKPFVEVLFEVLSNKSYLPKNEKVPYTEQVNQEEVKKIKSRSRSRSPKSIDKEYDKRNQSNNINFANEDRNRINSALRGSSRRYTNQGLNQHSSSRSPIKQRSRSPRKSPSYRRNKRSHSRSITKEFKRNKSSRSKSPINRTELKENNVGIKRRRCRDYDEKGFCMRGHFCMYDHGRDPVILDTINASSVLGLSANNTNSNANNALLPTPNNFCNNQTTNIAEPYNPEAPAMDAQVKRNVPINPNFSSRLPQQYWPTVNDNRIPNTINLNNNQFPSRQRELIGVQRYINEKNTNNVNIINENSNDQNRFKNNGIQTNGNLNNNNLNNSKRDTPRPERNRSNNYRSNKKTASQSFNSDYADKTTLEVRKIPTSLNTISHLNQHFSKFGTITNLQVGLGSNAETALIQFFKHSEALAAYRSTEAILNNRFIKVFWHTNNTSSINEINASSNNSNNVNTQINANNNLNNTDSEKIENNQTNLSVKDRLGKLEVDEKMAFLNNNVVNNLLNSGLISNTPNQLASLVVPTPKTNVFNPALFKKQYTTLPITTSSTSIPSVTTPTLSLSNSNATNLKSTSSSKEKLIKKLELQKKRQNILSTSVNQQKLLIQKLENAKTEKEKSEIKSTVDALTKQTKMLEQVILKEALLIKEESKISAS